MEKVKNIFGAFFDVNSFSIKKLIIAILFLFGFYVLKGLFSTLIIKIFKVKGKENIKSNSFYKPLRIFFGSLGLYISLMILGPTEGFKAIINKILRLLIIILCTYSLGNIVSPKSKFEKNLRKKITRANDAMIRMICKSLKVLIYVFGGVILISELGYNISGLIAGLGISGVAIALAAQDTASNILGALMIILDKPFEVGDWICVGTTEGSVEEFTFRSTRIREAKNSVVSIPNSTVVNSSITNWSRLQKRRINIDLVLEFSTTLKKVADVQNDILIYLENEQNILNDGLFVKFSDIKDDGYNLKIVCFTPIINYLDYMAYLDTVNYKIMSILNKNKVSLAYNSQTIYLRES
ncbi:MAG: mechanosensitive ion channel family protein [Clostridia bacterium]